MESNPDLSNVEVVKSVPVVGIQSIVSNKPDPSMDSSLAFEFDGYIPVGHVVMLDIENTDLQTVKRICKDYLSISFVLKSSENNYHVICPEIKSLTEIHTLLKSIEEVDQEFNDIGFFKGAYTLRVSKKGVKEAPVSVEVIFGDADNSLSKHIYSKPHLEFLEDYHDSTEASIIKNTYTCVGESLKLVKYFTRPNNHELMLDG